MIIFSELADISIYLVDDLLNFIILFLCTLSEPWMLYFVMYIEGLNIYWNFLYLSIQVN
jgi:hypothetical protein